MLAENFILARTDKKIEQGVLTAEFVQPNTSSRLIIQGQELRQGSSFDIGNPVKSKKKKLWM